VRPIRIALAVATLLLVGSTDVFAQGKPPVSWQPAGSGRYRSGRSQRITTVVIHTIEGSLQSGINTFRSGDRKVSAHYIVGRSGTIVQCVKDSDTAWHAGQANGYSVGIEHEGFSNRRDTWTNENMRASARLTRWLCDTYNIPIDRQHIIGHSEAPGATHGDPGRYFDWALYMKLVRGEGGSLADAGNGAANGDGGLSGNPGGSTTNPGGGSTTNPGDGSSAGTRPGGNGVAGIANLLDGGRGNRAPDGRLRNHENGYGTKNPLLEEGSRGEDVKRLQKILNAAGFGPLEEDGVFGRKTERALQKFQKANKCDVDGIAGPETWRALNKVNVPTATTTRATTTADDGDGLPIPVRRTR
jgi:N-acetyl-anhydromuramyl-L-alanine amidase AmpD